MFMSQSRMFSIIFGLIGLSIVIIVHELGHLIAAKMSGVPVETFSIGFGFPLFAINFGQTTYQLAMLPFGGYVSIAQQALDAQPYLIKVFILLSGIAANFLFAFIILMLFRWRNIDVRTMMLKATERSNNNVMGPIGIIALISYSATLGFSYFLLVLAALSISIGFFNLLPIPFFDGGQLAWYTIEEITGPLPDTVFNAITYIFLGLLLAFLFYITFKDIVSLRR
jgi:regulator of sigma E protease